MPSSFMTRTSFPEDSSLMVIVPYSAMRIRPQFDPCFCSKFVIVSLAEYFGASSDGESPVLCFLKHDFQDLFKSCTRS